MSSSSNQMEGRERNAPADRRAALHEVLLLADALIYSEGAETDEFFDRCCEIRRNATHYLETLKRFDELIDFFLPTALSELESNIATELHDLNS